jgi:hypothetical protein
MCIFGACARRIDLANESWIDENRTRGKNEVNVPLVESGLETNFTSVGDSAMSKHQQNRFPRLAIVGPTEKPAGQQPPGPRWWGPQRSRLKQATHTTRMPSQAIRMAVMPTLSRNLWFAAVGRMWSFLRSYFVTGPERRRGAAVLSFRRDAGAGFRRVISQESFASKKRNGNVRWNNDCGVAPQEGGRG